MKDPWVERRFGHSARLSGLRRALAIVQNMHAGLKENLSTVQVSWGSTDYHQPSVAVFPHCAAETQHLIHRLIVRAFMLPALHTGLRSDRHWDFDSLSYCETIRVNWKNCLLRHRTAKSWLNGHCCTPFFRRPWLLCTHCCH